MLLDAGHTLVFVDRERVAEIYRRLAIPWVRERFERAEIAARARLTRRVESGHLGTEPHLWRDYFLTLFRMSGVPTEQLDAVGEELRRAHRRSHLWTHVERGTAEALERLAGRGYRLAVISNADGRMEDALRRAGLRSQVEFVLDSGHMTTAKPDPRIFREGSRRLGLSPEECVYVGDLYPVDVVGARRAGMGALLLDPGGWSRGPAERVPSIRLLPDRLPDAPGS